MIRRAGQREKPASAPFSQDGWRAEVVERQFHVIMILEVERHADSQPQIFPTSDERTFLPQVLTVDGKCSIPAYIRFARFNSQIPAHSVPIALRLSVTSVRSA